VGWGIDQNHSRPEKLQKVSLNVESYEECYLKDRKYFSKRLKPGQNFCAGIKGLY